MSAARKKDRAVRVSMESDPEVDRWRKRLLKSAPSTADVWPRRLSSFCLQVGHTPASLLVLDLRGLVDQLDSFEEGERKKGNSGSYVAFTVKVVRSWLRYNGVDVPRGAVKVRDADVVKEETALSRSQLRAILNAATQREKVAVALMAMSGIRPMVLGNYRGDDGLRVRDCDLQIKKGRVVFGALPLRIVVRRELSKGNHQYLTFLGTEGANFLRDYIEARIRSGEKVGPDSPIVVPDRAERKFIWSTNIGDLVRHAIRGAELDVRPYCLRTTFATRTLSLEAEGKLPHAYASFWLGHRGDMTARYAQNRGTLPENVIQEMRMAYHRCEPAFRSSEPSVEDREEAKSILKAEILMIAGYTAEQAEKILGDPHSDVGAAIREKLMGAAPPTPQRIVTVDEAATLLSSGWRVVTSVAPGVLVLDPPEQPPTS
ncbi:MAG: site-specific integrase [Thermoplasmata archaeon]